ncbi:hypothetical protein LOD99_16038 [Oopsacas minuta]|uniref:BZIP domain-containing protein n=1 Tax=Oopsacas minuta TaxID=111878 RepID=A0AAV7K886_9METZ|nr:hypothetical protein LOD99_16038 [Oopsacas minuta]
MDKEQELDYLFTRDWRKIENKQLLDDFLKRNREEHLKGQYTMLKRQKCLRKGAKTHRINNKKRTKICEEECIELKKQRSELENERQILFGEIQWYEMQLVNWY